MEPIAKLEWENRVAACRYSSFFFSWNDQKAHKSKRTSLDIIIHGGGERRIHKEKLGEIRFIVSSSKNIIYKIAELQEMPLFDRKKEKLTGQNQLLSGAKYLRLIKRECVWERERVRETERLTVRRSEIILSASKYRIDIVVDRVVRWSTDGVPSSFLLLVLLLLLLVLSARCTSSCSVVNDSEFWFFV